MREFRQGKGTKTQTWKIWREGEYYFTEHGQLGGQQQQFRDRPGEKGKTGTKAFVSAEDNCIFHIEREIRKKLEHGYVEYVNGEPLAEEIKTLSFDKILPKNFCGYKPQTSIENASLLKLHQGGLARYTRKMDGMAHLCVHHTTGWEIYSRRMDLVTERYPQHIEGLSLLSQFDVGTILIGEMVCYREDGRDDFKAISSFCRSLPEESRRLVTSGEVVEPKFVIFDVLYLNGEGLNNWSYDRRSDLWKSLAGNLIAGVPYYSVTPETWEGYAKDRGWEGFVVTDGSSKPGDKFYSFDGDAKRPKGHYKLKPTYTEDCFIYAASRGGGKRLNGIGALFVGQVHPETGQLFSCGKVGSGFTEEDLAFCEDLCQRYNIPILEKDKEAEKLQLRVEDVPVVELEFGERQPGTNKFRFPVFLRVRDDKLAKECIAQKLAAEEE